MDILSIHFPNHQSYSIEWDSNFPWMNLLLRPLILFPLVKCWGLMYSSPAHPSVLSFDPFYLSPVAYWFKNWTTSRWQSVSILLLNSVVPSSLCSTVIPLTLNSDLTFCSVHFSLSGGRQQIFMCCLFLFL